VLGCLTTYRPCSAWRWQTKRKLVELCGQDDERLSVFAEAATVIKGMPSGAYPPLELEWLAVSAWNRGCHHERFGRNEAARSFMRAAQELMQHCTVKRVQMEVWNALCMRLKRAAVPSRMHKSQYLLCASQRLARQLEHAMLPKTPGAEGI